MARKRPFRRTDRLASQIQQVLAVAVQRETREDALRGVVVTAVDVTSDLSLARVFYYLMSGDPAAVEQALERARGFLRRRVGEQIRARTTPELRFVFDASVEHGRRIEEILSGLDIPPAPVEEEDEDDDDALEGYDDDDLAYEDDDDALEGYDDDLDDAADGESLEGDDDALDGYEEEAEQIFDEEEAFDEDDGLFHEETDAEDLEDRED